MRISDWSSDVCSSDLETKSGRISFETQLIGERPAGATPADAPIVRATVGAIKAIGLTPDVFASSTDSNIAMSIGIPAVTVGYGGDGGRSPSLAEHRKRVVAGKSVSVRVEIGGGRLKKKKKT